MWNFLKHGRTSNFSMPLAPPIFVGAFLACIFYASIFLGMLDHPLVRRYCLGHPVAILTVTLFLMSVSALLLKYSTAIRQGRLFAEGSDRLNGILQAAQGLRGSEGERHDSATHDDRDSSFEAKAALSARPAEWLQSMWEMESTSLVQSWFGCRLLELLHRQSKRGDASRLDDDLRELSERDADAQHESYGVVRIMTWAMPMLGFLGTVIGISSTLGRMDTTQLASGSQEAMNNMTAGLYVAFDTTAVALVLTILTMFLQFVVTRMEQNLLREMDDLLTSKMVGWFARAQAVTPSRIEDLLVDMTLSLRQSFESLLIQQVTLWQGTIAAANERWQAVAAEGTQIIRQQLLDAIEASLTKQMLQFQQLQVDGAAQFELRWQQWQTSFSEQSRMLFTQQRELATQTGLLKELISKGDAFERLDQSMEQNLKRLTDVDRFHEAAMCMTEAVAFLATQMERSGMLRSSPRTAANEPSHPTVRRRAA